MSDEWARLGSNKAMNRPTSPRSQFAREAIPPSFAHQSRAAVSQVPASSASSGKRTSENVQKFAGLAVGIASVFSEHVLSHPCIVLRRQCQVHNTAQWYHLTPFTLFHTVFNIHRHQSVTTLWKGIGSTLMVKGLVVASETAIHELTPLPREVNRHSSMKKIAEHLLLKSISYIVVTPFFAASLVETVQSEIACERPGVFDCIVEGVSRLVSFTSTQPTRLLPIWKMLVPAVIYGLSHYVIASLAKYRVSVTMKNNIWQSKRIGASDEDSDRASERSIYETYYPELVATFTGNLLADTMLYPLETILHRLYLQGTRTIIDNTDTGLEVLPIITRYDGAIDCYSTILAEEGFSGLYKGFGALILQYALHVAVLKLTRLIFDLLSTSPDAPPPIPYIAPPPMSALPGQGAAAYDPLSMRGPSSARLRSDYLIPPNGD